MTYDETSVDQTIGRLLEEYPDVDASVAGALDTLDQFHSGGAAAVDLLIPTLHLGPHDRVVDVGSGFGGPARQIATRTGNAVVGIDITAAYVDAARDLTARAGLASLVTFQLSDIAAFEPDEPFEAAITMHVQMNVRDKTAWFGQIGKTLAEGARLAVWEICQPEEAPLPWPLPWSLDGSDSFVVSADVLRESIEAGGFSTHEWIDCSDWVETWFADALGSGAPAGPALPLLLDDGYTRVINLASALQAGTLQVWRGAFTRKSRSRP
jgi:SAM-dependent methyltransferase